MDALVLRPLNVPEAESLWSTQYGVATGCQSYPNYLDLRDSVDPAMLLRDE
jgi:hypothetical protein